MISNVFKALEERREAVIVNDEESLPKGAAKVFGYSALIGLLESFTIVGGVVALAAVASTIENKITKNK